ncbi:MAG: hypothetical protein LBD06_03005 [Candidatus Accumulibacter sp.]|jgi:hypothetical protein|nr:hypothetical protein [Accumulibacter sp.]
MNAKEFEKKLESLDGFKAIFGGLFGGGKAKASFEIYRSAQKKGVYDVAVLRREKHEDNHYAIMAFSTQGSIDKDTLQVITERANDVSLGTIRYECLGYAKLEPYRGQPGSLANKNTEITSIADGFADLFVFPISESESGLDCPFLIYANKDGQDHIFPVARKRLK